MSILLLIAAIKDVQKKLINLTLHKKSKTQIKQSINDCLFLILILCLFYLIKLKESEKKTSNPILVLIIIYILKLNEYGRNLCRRHKKPQNRITKLLNELLVTVLFLLQNYSTSYEDKHRYSLNSNNESTYEYPSDFNSESTYAYTEQNTVVPSVACEHILEKSVITKEASNNDDKIIDLLDDYNLLEQNASIEQNDHNKSIVSPSNNLPTMIKEIFRGVTISTLITNTDIITGEVVFNLPDVTALKLENRIVFINEKQIIGFF